MEMVDGRKVVDWGWVVLLCLDSCCLDDTPPSFGHQRTGQQSESRLKVERASKNERG